MPGLAHETSLGRRHQLFILFADLHIHTLALQLLPLLFLETYILLRASSLVLLVRCLRPSARDLLFANGYLPFAPTLPPLTYGCLQLLLPPPCEKPSRTPPLRLIQL